LPLLSVSQPTTSDSPPPPLPRRFPPCGTRPRCIIPQYAREDPAALLLLAASPLCAQNGWFQPSLPGKPEVRKALKSVDDRCRGHRRRVDPAGGDTGALRQGAGARTVHSSGDGETRAWGGFHGARETGITRWPILPRQVSSWHHVPVRRTPPESPLIVRIRSSCV
jgi:hypothetical protein